MVVMCVAIVSSACTHGLMCSRAYLYTCFFHSLIEFFRKIKKWSEMAKLSSGFTEKVETLERKFEVASIIFDKYKKEFCDIFQCPEDKQTPGGVRQCGRKSSKYATPFALHCVDCHDDELFVLSNCSFFLSPTNCAAVFCISGCAHIRHWICLSTAGSFMFISRVSLHVLV